MKNPNTKPVVAHIREDLGDGLQSPPRRRVETAKPNLTLIKGGGEGSVASREVPQNNSRPDLRRAAVRVACGVATVALVFGAYKSGQDSVNKEKRVEACVSEAVGHRVDLQTDPERGNFIVPESVQAEIKSCA
jgi:hypothetical protein